MTQRIKIIATDPSGSQVEIDGKRIQGIQSIRLDHDLYEHRVPLLTLEIVSTHIEVEGHAEIHQES